MEQSIKMNDRCRKNYLFTSALFEGTDVREMEKLSLNARLKQYAKGEIIAHEGNKCTSIGVLLKGSVSMQKISSGGEFATIALLNEGDFFGEEIIYSSQNTYSATLEANTGALIASISKDYINVLMNENPVIKDKDYKLKENIFDSDQKLDNMMTDKDIKNLFIKSARGTYNNSLKKKFKDKKFQIFFIIIIISFRRRSIIKFIF